MQSLARDVRYSLRVLRKSPVFTIAAVFTLGLGICANAVVFSVFNTFILHPLNVPESQSLYMIERGSSKDGSQSYPDYVDLRDRTRSFDGLAAFNPAVVALDTGDDPMRAWAQEASGNFFDVLQIHPYIGRFFHSTDEHGPNSAPYIVLTYAYWKVHFHEDMGVTGRVVQVNRHPFTVLGVAPPEFHGTILFFFPDFFVPIVNQEQIEGENDLNARGQRSVFMVMGHLKPGVSPSQASADLNLAGADLELQYPKEDSDMKFTLARPGLYGDFLGGPVRAFLTGLVLLTGLILLATCANLGSLFAARAADRSWEVALRLALGSDRKLILRQLLTEALLIALSGGIIGVLVTLLLLRGLSQWQPLSRWPVHLPVTPDPSMYGVALLLSLASGLLFGMIPVRQVLRATPYDVARLGSTGHIGRSIAVTDILLVGQIAICTLLVTAAMVAFRGLLHSLHSDFGFHPINTMLLNTNLNMDGYKGDAVPVMQKRMIKAAEAIPGVQSVGLVDMTPLYGMWNSFSVFRDQTTDFRQSNAAADAITYNISPEYFVAAGTTLFSGRSFTWNDNSSAPQVAVINQTLARKLFVSEANALGESFKIKEGKRVQVVGIAKDGKYGSLTEDPRAAMFLPILQSPSSSTWLVVRSNRDIQELAGAMQSTSRGLDPGLAVTIGPWNKELDSALFGSRMATISLGVLGGLGFLLSISGILGVTSYSVSRRHRELGIRMALGAQRSQVLNAALGRTLKLVVFGSFTGVVLGVLASRVLALIVYQPNPRDPLVLGAVILAMVFMSLVGLWIPARRALAVDPVRLLCER